MVEKHRAHITTVPTVHPSLLSPAKTDYYQQEPANAHARQARSRKIDYLRRLARSLATQGSISTRRLFNDAPFFSSDAPDADEFWDDLPLDTDVLDELFATLGAS